MPLHFTKYQSESNTNRNRRKKLHAHETHMSYKLEPIITLLQNYIMPEMQGPIKAHTTPHLKAHGKNLYYIPKSPIRLLVTKNGVMVSKLWHAFWGFRNLSLDLCMIFASEAILQTPNIFYPQARRWWNNMQGEHHTTSVPWHLFTHFKT